MKKFNKLCLVTLILALSLFISIGCDNGGGGSSGSNNTGSKPEITDEDLFSWNGSEWVLSHTFYIGSFADFNIYTHDDDMNLTECIIKQFYPMDATEPYYEPSPMLLPSQESADMSFYPVEIMDVDGPAGQWRIEFQLKDAKGNVSNVWTEYVAIE